MISDLLSSISQFLSLTHNTRAMLGMFGLLMTNSLQHVCPWTWQLNVQRPPYASLHKTRCLSSISHDSLLFQLGSIGAVCSRCISIAVSPPFSPPTFIYAQHCVELSLSPVSCSTLHLPPAGDCASFSVSTLLYFHLSLPMSHTDDT